MLRFFNKSSGDEPAPDPSSNGGNNGNTPITAAAPDHQDVSPQHIADHEAADPGTPEPQAEEIIPTFSPEQLCGLEDGMTVDQVRNQLALLYRRHNRAASSLIPDLRQEAEIMLNAIVECRYRYLGDED